VIVRDGTPTPRVNQLIFVRWRAASRWLLRHLNESCQRCQPAPPNSAIRLGEQGAVVSQVTSSATPVGIPRTKTNGLSRLLFCDYREYAQPPQQCPRSLQYEPQVGHMVTRPPKDYRSEFKELGIAKVKRELMMRRWLPDKLSAARVWVEDEDNRQWVAGRGGAPPGDARKSFRKWAMYIAIAFGFAYVAVRVFRSLA